MRAMAKPPFMGSRKGCHSQPLQNILQHLLRQDSYDHVSGTPKSVQYLYRDTQLVECASLSGSDVAIFVILIMYDDGEWNATASVRKPAFLQRWWFPISHKPEPLGNQKHV